MPVTITDFSDPFSLVYGYNSFQGAAENWRPGHGGQLPSNGPEGFQMYAAKARTMEMSSQIIDLMAAGQQVPTSLLWQMDPNNILTQFDPVAVATPLEALFGSIGEWLNTPISSPVQRSILDTDAEMFAYTRFLAGNGPDPVQAYGYQSPVTKGEALGAALALGALVLPELRGVRAAESGIWKLHPLERGRQIERAFGHNLPSNFPTIDRFENGVATSIKSIDLDAASYLNDATLNRMLTGYVDRAAVFNGRTWAGRRIQSDDIAGRGLDLVIPHGGTASQQAIINQAVRYGSTRGVIVNPIIYP